VDYNYFVSLSGYFFVGIAVSELEIYAPDSRYRVLLQNSARAGAAEKNPRPVAI